MELLIVFIVLCVLIGAFVRQNYLVLSLLVLILLISRSINGVWGGDFWEHSAILRELSSHPIAPRHPMLLLNAPHPFFSPYSVGLALLARAFHADHLTTLSWAGIFNFVFLVASLYLFVMLVTGKGKTAFYTLIFTLFLWGKEPQDYSGFFHWGVLGYVIPYPSTFATGLGLLILSCAILFLRGGGRKWLGGIYALSPILFLSHPFTAMVICVGIMALTISGIRKEQAHFVNHALLLASIPFAFLVSLTWPYYSMLALLQENSLYNIWNQAVYDHLWEKIFPAFLGLPFMLQRLRKDPRDFLAWMFLGLLGLCVYGGVSGNYSYGRALPALILTVHIVLAQWFARQDESCGKKGGAYRLIWPLIACLPIFINSHYYATAFRQCVPGYPSSYIGYPELGRFMGQYETIFSDQHTSWMIPTFGGKVAAPLHPSAFVVDNDERIDDEGRFFDPRSSLTTRKQILEKYKADFLLLNTERLRLNTLQITELESMGRVIYRKAPFILIRLPSKTEE